jgi:hypothetical protein
MRVISLLAVFTMVWAASIGVAWAQQVPQDAPSVGEFTMCIVPMGPTVWPVGSCSTRPETLSGGRELTSQ